jgi:spermidine synthase
VRRRVFLLAYACSGAAGLIYEVVWMRLLALSVGHTVAATGTVLAAFMGGLAAGAMAAGGVASRADRRRALRIYAAIELAIALCALAVPLLLAASVPLLRGAYQRGPGVAFAFARIAASFAVLFLPAAAMGATFPFALRFFTRAGARGAADASWLYTVNTAGAALGALATGFVLIPSLGLRATTGIGIALNLAAAVAAIAIAHAETADPATLQPADAPRRTPPRPATRRSKGRRDAPAAVPAPQPAWLPIAIAALAGFVTLVFEVAFTRLLAVALGPTSYAFAAMLVAFITGLAIGAAVASAIKPSWNVAAVALAALTALGAVAAITAGSYAATALPLRVAQAAAATSGSASMLSRQAFYAMVVLLPLSIAFGTLFPICAMLSAARGEALARQVSIVYGVNTIAAIAGSLAAAFVLLPLGGVQPTLRIACALALAVALLGLAAAPSARQRIIGAAALAIAAALVLFAQRWDPNLLSSGPYKYASQVRASNLNLEVGLTAGRLLYYREGATATVSVRQLAGTTALAIDGKVDASNGTDMLTQKLLAHLPLLLHPDPRRIAVIGLGSGVTLGAALRHGVTQADVVEISPEVVEAAALFERDNGGALRDPRARLILADGRTHLQLSAARYDAIISEPSNPWMAGVASLFTEEFFRTARARLAPGGIICQWAHTYDLSAADLRSIAATFSSVFPTGTIWLVGAGDVLFVASEHGEPLPIADIAKTWSRPGVAADLAAVSVFEPFSLLSLYVTGPSGLRRYAGGAIIQTDDRNALEFSGPLALYASQPADNEAELRALADRAELPAAARALLERAGASEWKHRGEMLMKAHAYAMAYEAFAQSAALDAADDAALAGWVEAAAASGRTPEVQRALESLARANPDRTAPGIALARLLAAGGAFEPAIVRARAIVAAHPDDPRALELLASIVADAGDAAALQPLVARMRNSHPERDETWYYAAVLSFLTDRLEDALSAAGRAIELNPRHTLARNLLGSTYARQGQRDRARQAFGAALETNPAEPSTYTNLGLLELEGGNPQAAVSYFAEALTLDPADDRARSQLAAALAAASHR